MLSIKTLEGLDLTLNEPPDNYVALPNGVAHLPVRIALQLVEDDATLPTMRATGTIDWNDGSQPVTFFGAGTIAMQSTRLLKTGNYVISVYGRNYHAPEPDSVRVSLAFNVRSDGVESSQNRYVYGPILPRDNGYPNARQWAFSEGSDTAILESSVKMLLTTEIGERVMEPDYGTNLKRLLFEANIAAIEAAVRDEIVSALTRWEPRVDLRSLKVERFNERNVSVQAIFVSKLTYQSFLSTLNFSN